MSRVRTVICGVVVLPLVASTLLLGGAGPAAAAPGGIVISEINYHAGSDVDTDDFLELANTAATAIDMSGWTFTEGIFATIPDGSVVPAGGYFVLSPDPARFQTLYGFAPDATYTDKLGNGGETITLTDDVTPVANVIDTVTYDDAAPWPVAPDGTGPSLELRDLMSDNTQATSWGASTVNGGTPKAANSIAGTGALPTVSEVTASPQRPAPNQAITVSARLPVGSSATLAYKVMFASDVTVAFRDDAASPGGAGDGVFAATIPGQGAGQLVRYRIDATSDGSAFSYPSQDDSVAYVGVVVTNPAVVSNLPVVEWFMADSVYNDLLANHRLDDVTGPAVLAYDGSVIDNVQMRIRGNSSRTATKVSWKVELPAGHVFDLGGRLPYPLDEFAIQNYSHAFADVGWNTVGAAGARRLAIIPVRTQRNGQFWSVGRVMELEDGAWRKAQGVDDWSIYKGDGGSLAKTASPAALAASAWLDKKSPKGSGDFSDVWDLSQHIDAPASAAQKSWIMKNVNVPELINYMAINSIMRHQDSGWYNWFVARDTNGTGRWELWHWDLDWIFTLPSSDGKGTFLTPDTSNRFTRAMLAYPDFREMFYRRLRTLADQLLPAGRYEAMWDSITTPYTADWNLDRAKWGGYTPGSARSSFVSGLANRRAVIADNTGPGKPVPASQSVNPAIVVSELMYAPAGGGAEYIEVANPSTTESVDLSGWRIDPVGLTVAPGTVLLPGAYAVFTSDDAAFRAAYSTPDRFVAGEFHTPLPDSSATVALRDGSGRLVDTVSYSSSAPWPTTAGGSGRSIELRSLAADNSLPGSWSASAAGGSPGLANPSTPTTDTTAPSIPAGVTVGTVTSSSVVLGWNASTDNVGVAGYRVYRGGADVSGLVPGLSFTDTGLTAGTSYTYTVRAFDAAGNGSDPSAAVPATTSTGGGGGGGSGSVLYSDTWTQPDGAAWSSAWTTSVRSGSATTQGGGGVLGFTDTSGGYARAQLTGIAATADSDLTVSYAWSSTTSRAYLEFGLRASGAWANGYRLRNGYYVELSSSSRTITVAKSVNGTVTTLGTISNGQALTTAKQWIRLRVVGSTIAVRVWTDGQAQPTAWAYQATDTTLTAPGQVFASLNRSSSNSGAKSVRIDDLVLSAS